MPPSMALPIFRQWFDPDSSTCTCLLSDSAEFITLMQGLKLEKPRLPEHAVPASRACGPD